MRLLIIAAVITMAYGHTACPPLWTAFKTNCYRLFPSRLRHADAKTTCGQFAPCNAAALGQLVKISDVQENEFLTMYVNSFVSTPPPSSADIWIGATDVGIQNTWTWGDGSAVLYTNWDFGPPRQPDNGAASGGQPEDCVMFGGEKGTWFDASCQMMMPYICQMPAEMERPMFPGFQPPYNPGPSGPQLPNNPNNPTFPGRGV